MKNSTIQQIQLSGYYYRGQIISDLIHLERLIDEFISRHFCNNHEKKKEFFELIIANERMSFNSKIQVFEYIFKKHYKNVVEENSSIFSDIKNFNDERNIVAHYLLNTSPEGEIEFEQNKKIGFVKFRNSTEDLWRDSSDNLKWREITSKYIRLFEKIISET